MLLLQLFNTIDKNLKNGIKLKNMIEILKNYNGSDWKEYIKLNKIRYNRNIVYKNNNLELIIVTWNKNQSTEIHEHPKNGCLFKILQGNIDEYLYNDKIQFNNYKINDIKYIDNSIGKHKMINDDEICISLHLYSPPYE